MNFSDLLTSALATDVISKVIGSAIATVVLYVIAKLISAARAPTARLVGVVMQSAKRNWGKLLSLAIDLAILFFLFAMLKSAVQKTGPVERIDVVEISVWVFFLLGYALTLAFARGRTAQMRD